MSTCGETRVPTKGGERGGVLPDDPDASPEGSSADKVGMVPPLRSVASAANLKTAPRRANVRGHGHKEQYLPVTHKTLAISSISLRFSEVF